MRKIKIYMRKDKSSIILLLCLFALSMAACGKKAAPFAPIDPPPQKDTSKYNITPGVLPNSGVLFVDHQKSNRSGHGGQAITECTNGDILAFYSNVALTENDGHNVDGWAEYRISSDGGKTWSDARVLPASKKVWDERIGNKAISMLVWEVMTAPNGTIVAIGRRSSQAERWGDLPPVYLRSYDHGRTWTEPQLVDPDAADWQISRDEASMVHNGELYVLFYDFYNPLPPPPYKATYRLYVSSDNGETFHKRSDLPFSSKQEYGALGVLPNGDIIAYSYNGTDDGRVLQYVTSSDQGKTWSEVKETPFAKRIRKPRMSGRIGEYYFMHGRSGNNGDDPRHFVLYSSKDGINWDHGIFLNKGATTDVDSYSANEIIGKYNNPSGKKKLLIQASITYTGKRVNLHHWFIDFE